MPKVKITGLPRNEIGNTLKKVKIVKIPKTFKAQTGGTPIVKGLPDSMHHLANVEAEAGEVYQNNSGDINKISDQEKDHEQGGVMIPDAQRVLEDTSTKRKDKYSKVLKISPKEAETIFGFKPKKPLSHAEAYEYATAQYGKEVDKFNNSLKNTNDEGDLDKLSVNTLKLNLKNRAFVPKPQDVFNTLFEHQEAIKAVHEIPDDGKQKYGGFKPKKQTGGFNQGPKAVTPQGQFTTTGLDTNQNPDISLDDYKKKWKEAGLDLSKYKTVKDAQLATYKFLADNNPEVLQDMWQKSGLTNLGRKNADKLQKLGIDLAPNPNDKFKRLDVADWSKVTPYQLRKLGDLAYADNNFRIRSLVPTAETSTESVPGTEQIQPSATNEVQSSTSGNPGVKTNLNFLSQPKNGFHEDTHWYDIAPALAEGVDSLTRDSELYNPVQLHQLKYKLLNPTAALNANQSDYEAGLNALEQQNLGSGVAAANVANLTAQKYKANNQVLGQYENANTGIVNQEIGYNTQVRDRQSLQDANSRASFYNNVLKARDNQRLQKLQAIQDISRVQQLKARQNSSGNLVMKLSPAFNQEGEYNGYEYAPTLPSDIGYETVAPTVKRSSGKTTTTTKYKIGDREIKKVNNG